MATVKQVNAACEKAYDDLGALYRQLSAERETIKMTAFDAGRPLTDKEIKRRKEIAATQQEITEILKDLAKSTIQALEKADNVAWLLAEINASNQQLADDLKALKRKAAYAQKAAKVTATLTDAAAKVAKLAVKIGLPV